MFNPSKTYDDQAYTAEQARRAQKLFGAVVLAALDDAIKDNRAYGNGCEQIVRWARSRDGREILTMAGIEPSYRVAEGLAAFVERGVNTSTALTQKD